jgi:hypothetical protein
MILFQTNYPFQERRRHKQENQFSHFQNSGNNGTMWNYVTNVTRIDNGRKIKYLFSLSEQCRWWHDLPDSINISTRHKPTVSGGRDLKSFGLHMRHVLMIHDANKADFAAHRAPFYKELPHHKILNFRVWLKFTKFNFFQ